MHDHIFTAHRNFLRDAVYYLYTNNRLKEAGEWFRYLAKQYPNKPALDGKPDSFPGKLTLDEFAIGRAKENTKEFMGKDEAEMFIEGLLATSFEKLVLDEDAESEGYRRLAKQTWLSHQSQVPKERIEAIGLRPFEDLQREILNRMLDPQKGFPPEPRAILRSKLGMPTETAPTQPSTNGVPDKLESR